MQQELAELKNLIMQTLETNGQLAKIRASIRASVFNVVDPQDNHQKLSPFYSENKRIQSIKELETGRELLELIKEFLRFYEMSYTNSIFSSEANLREEINRDSIVKRLNLNIEDKNKPLLHWILVQALQSQKNQKLQLSQSTKTFGSAITSQELFSPQKSVSSQISKSKPLIGVSQQEFLKKQNDQFNLQQVQEMRKTQMEIQKKQREELQHQEEIKNLKLKGEREREEKEIQEQRNKLERQKLEQIKIDYELKQKSLEIELQKQAQQNQECEIKQQQFDIQKKQIEQQQLALEIQENKLKKQFQEKQQEEQQKLQNIQKNVIEIQQKLNILLQEQTQSSNELKQIKEQIVNEKNNLKQLVEQIKIEERNLQKIKQQLSIEQENKQKFDNEQIIIQKEIIKFQDEKKKIIEQKNRQEKNQKKRNKSLRVKNKIEIKSYVNQKKSLNNLNLIVMNIRKELQTQIEIEKQLKKEISKEQEELKNEKERIQIEQDQKQKENADLRNERDFFLKQIETLEKYLKDAQLELDDCKIKLLLQGYSIPEEQEIVEPAQKEKESEVESKAKMDQYLVTRSEKRVYKEEDDKDAELQIQFKKKS